MIIVELRNVTKIFKDFIAVNNVSFYVESGEFFSLLGPSGCGKTTTLRMIAGFVEPTKGEIYIKGQPMKGVPPFKRPTNLVFQNLALFPHMDVYGNISFGLKMKKLPKDEIDRRVKDILELVRLSGMEKRKIKQLSGGQQQRVAIARALVNQPEVLLLDEPLGPLDLKLREEMILELKRIQRDVKTTFIYVTHDQGEALAMSDRIAVMKEGRIIQIGSPKEIYDKPKTKFVADFIGSGNLFEGEIADGIIEVKNLGQIHVDFSYDFTPLNNSSVLVCIRPEKIAVGRTLKGYDNVFDGEVKEVNYQGAFIIYKVMLKDGRLITAKNFSGDVGPLLNWGDKVKVGWNSGDCILIPIDGVHE